MGCRWIQVVASASAVLVGCSGKVINYEAPDSGSGSAEVDAGAGANAPGAQLVTAAAHPDGGAFRAECQQFCGGTGDLQTCASTCQCSQECPCIDACLTFANGCGADCATLMGASADAGPVAAAEQALASCSSTSAMAVPIASPSELGSMLAGRWFLCTTSPSAQLAQFAVGVEFAGDDFYYLYLNASLQIVRGTAPSTYGTVSITQQGPGQFQLRLSETATGMLIMSSPSSGAPTSSGGESYVLYTPSFQSSPRQLWLAAASDPGGQAPDAVVLVPAP